MPRRTLPAVEILHLFPAFAPCPVICGHLRSCGSRFAEGSPIGVWTNGSETIALHREEPNIFRSLPDIPNATQRLAEMLAERWTLDDLEKHNKLVTERRSLKSVILDMEDLVLANAGVEAFDEVFKLVYAKLFDEWQAARGGKTKRYLEFRVGGSTAAGVSPMVIRLAPNASVRRYAPRTLMRI